MVKWISNILAIYLTILTFIPCADGAADICCMSKGTCDQTEIPETNHDNDHCPPSCFCSCCGTTYVFSFKKNIPTIIPKEPNPTQNFFYQSPLGIIFHTDIWQPPRA